MAGFLLPPTACWIRPYILAGVEDRRGGLIDQRGPFRTGFFMEGYVYRCRRSRAPASAVVQQHSVNAFGHTIHTVGFGLFSQATQFLNRLWMQSQLTRPHFLLLRKDRPLLPKRVHNRDASTCDLFQREVRQIGMNVKQQFPPAGSHVKPCSFYLCASI